MSACIVVVNWPDLAHGTGASPELVAHSLRRQLGCRFDLHTGLCWIPEARLRPVFQRWGFRPLASPPDASLLLELSREHRDKSHMVLALDPARLAGALPQLRHLPQQVELWDPTRLNGSGPAPWALEGWTVRPLPDILNLATSHPVALFADWTHLSAGLRRVGQHRDSASMAESLLRAGEWVGSVVTARMYGLTSGGDPLEFSGTGRLGSHVEDSVPWDASEQLREDLFQFLDDPRAPRTWIVSAGAEWLTELIRAAHRRSIRILLWAADGAYVPSAACAEADSYTGLFSLLPRTEVEPDRVAPARGTQLTHPTVWSTIQVSPPAVETPLAAAREAEPTPEGGPPSQPVAASARLGPWLRLMYYVECTLRRNAWTKIAFRKLAGSLAALDEFGPTPTNALMWLNRAKAEGMLVVEQEAHRADPSIRVTTCRPNPEHLVARAAVDVPDRCLRLLRQMLQKMPWVSFKLLRSVLLREQWLGGATYQLDELAVDEWLNFLIHDGALLMTKEPNLENPDYPVTALRLNDEHPLSRAVLLEATEGKRLAAERAILAIDHFLTRNRKPWMAMSALRRALESMGRDELQVVLQGLQNLGVLLTESYPNPQKEHYTTGCRLKSDEPIVASTLQARNAIIRMTQYHQRYRNWVPLSRLEEDLAVPQNPLAASADRLAWFLLLRDEGILELEQETLPPTGWGNIRCRLNVTDAVVRAVVAETLSESA